jgi:dihydroorotate dehydrogenase
MTKRELLMKSPLMNAAGFLGFMPDTSRAEIMNVLGGFITNHLTLHARQASTTRFIQSFPGGFFFHNGLPNLGLKTALQIYSKKWNKSTIPIILHIEITNPGETDAVLGLLDGEESIAGIELGFPEGWSQDQMIHCIQSMTSEQTVIACLTDIQFELISTRIAVLDLAGISLAPIRGIILDENGAKVSGRIYGPALYPQTLLRVTKILPFGIPVYASGGIISKDQAIRLLEFGVTAVQFDSEFWRGMGGYPNIILQGR